MHEVAWSLFLDGFKLEAGYTFTMASSRRVEHQGMGDEITILKSLPIMRI